jgi:uncharacterized protein (DUF169 family)
MFAKNVKILENALLLDNTPVGIRFLNSTNEYDELPVEKLQAKINFCYMVRRAIRGKHFKAAAGDFRCVNALYALGLVKPGSCITSGEVLSICGLYENLEVAKAVIDNMRYPKKQIFGIEIGPLREMELADVIIIVADTYQTMRIFQGYTYSHGPADNLLSMGNQAMCSDLVAKPLYNNDINVSFFCRGARIFGQCSRGELGIGMPADLFDSVVNGVIQTLTPVETDKIKYQILQRLDESQQLGTEIKMGVSYVQTIAEYIKNHRADKE